MFSDPESLSVVSNVLRAIFEAPQQTVQYLVVILLFVLPKRMVSAPVRAVTVLQKTGLLIIVCCMLY